MQINFIKKVFDTVKVYKNRRKMHVRLGWSSFCKIGTKLKSKTKKNHFKLSIDQRLSIEQRKWRGC